MANFIRIIKKIIKPAENAWYKTIYFMINMLMNLEIININFRIGNTIFYKFNR